MQLHLKMPRLGSKFITFTIQQTPNTHTRAFVTQEGMQGLPFIIETCNDAHCAYYYELMVNIRFSSDLRVRPYTTDGVGDARVLFWIRHKKDARFQLSVELDALKCQAKDIITIG